MESFDIGDTVKIYGLPLSFITHEATLTRAADIQTFIFDKKYDKSVGNNYLIRAIKMGRISGYTMKTTRMVLIEKNMFNEAKIK